MIDNIVIDTARVSNKTSILVVRDDVIPGGTKQRALEELLPILGKGTYVYASPAEGYGQLALAYACQQLGTDYNAVIFTALRKTAHPRTEQVKRAGATVYTIVPGYLNVVQKQAQVYAARNNASLLPFGMDFPEMQTVLTREAQRLPFEPREVWTVAGSGLLTRSLQAAWPRASFKAVQVGRPANIGKAELFIAPEKFEQDAKFPPPFPSCSNYDAKAWQFIRRYAKDGALFWNVAR